MAADLLKDLPSANQSNFSRFSPETTYKGPPPKAILLLRDINSCQQVKVIVCDKTPILLRYLHQQLKKDSDFQLKRTGVVCNDNSEDGSSTTAGQPSRKMPRIV